MSTPERDPDLGPTKQTPSTAEQLDKLELQSRAMRLRHFQEQRKMIEEANEITRHKRRRSTI